MIETLFLDWPFSFAAGLVFGLAGRREIERAGGRGFSTRAFRWGLAYMHVGVIPLAAVYYALRPDWMWMYWVDASAIPVAVVVLLFTLYEACFVAGFVAGPALERARRGAGVAAAVAVAAAITAAEVVARARLVRLGSFEDFHAGWLARDFSLSPFHLTPLAWALAVAVPVSTVALFVLAWRLARRVP